MLAALECVDYVACFEEDTPIEIIKHLNPEVLVKGHDYIDKEVVGRDYAGKVVFAPFVDGLSTTNIIDSIVRKII
jgi:D-beta-D-heptose 7-phosphate kinase/D-beta-D-heptose 1-phosphate adenosyltransferase